MDRTMPQCRESFVINTPDERWKQKLQDTMYRVIQNQIREKTNIDILSEFPVTFYIAYDKNRFQWNAIFKVLMNKTYEDIAVFHDDTNSQEWQEVAITMAERFVKHFTELAIFIFKREAM